MGYVLVPSLVLQFTAISLGHDGYPSTMAAQTLGVRGTRVRLGPYLDRVAVARNQVILTSVMQDAPGRDSEEGRLTSSGKLMKLPL